MAYDDQAGLLPGAADQGGFFSNLNSPTNQGLLAAGLAILSQANGPNSRGAIGAGGLAGVQAMQAAQQNAYLGDYRKAQAAKLTQDAEKQRMVLGLLGRLNGGAPAGGGSGAGAPLAGAVPAGSPSVMPGAGGGGGAQGFPLSLNDVTALKLAGVDVFDQYKYANDGVKRDAGAFYDNPVSGKREYIPKIPDGMTPTVGPNGQVTLSLIPGYAQGNAAVQGSQAGAVAAAQYPYQIGQNRDQQQTAASLDLVPVPDGNGGTTMMPRSIAASALGGGGAGRLGRTPSATDQTFDTDVAKASADTYNGLQKAAGAADGQISKLQKIGSLLGDFDGNKYSPAGLELAKFGKSLGIDIGSNVGNKEAAQALSNELALSARSTADGGGMPGAMSDADRQFLVSLNPGMANSAEGRKQLIDTRVKVLQRSKDVAMFARKWRQRYGRLDSLDQNGSDFQTALSDWSAQNPLFPQQEQ